MKQLETDAYGVGAFDKPAGILSHPNRGGDQARSILNARYDEVEQCYHWKDTRSQELRLWLLNRLDGATSGVILTAASKPLAEAVRIQFAKKKVRKIYQALVFGQPTEKSQLWCDFLAVQKKGRQVRTTCSGNIPVTTQFQLQHHSQGVFSTSLLHLEPHTGRSHQLRVQCIKRHLPIVGDKTYGDFGLNRTFAKATGLKRLFLHSLETSFSYEFGGRSQHFRAKAPLPPDFFKRY